MRQPAFRPLPLLLPLLLVAAVAAAHADAPTLPYRLGGQSSFQQGCFEPCLCPIALARLEGTFGLTPAGHADGYATFRLSDIDWRIGEAGSRARGSGVFRLKHGDPPLQQLVLDLSIDGGPVQRYDSGVVPGKTPFPRIDALASLHDLFCYDEAFHVQASPATERAVTFAFTGLVENVFDGLGALGGEIAPGTRFRGTFTFDPDTPNTAEPIDEGEAGLYHHDHPPAGVRLRLPGLTFRSSPRHPDFDVIVNNDFGFSGSDEFGFRSGDNEARGLPSSPPIEITRLDWLAQTFTEDPLSSVELPLRPPDLALLGGGTLVIRGECTLCMGPAAFFQIEGTLTSLTLPARLTVDSSLVGWEGPEGASAHDLIAGDLAALRAGGPEAFGQAPAVCLADDETAASIASTAAPAPGEAWWFLVRPVAAEPGTYDSFGLTQLGARDEGMAVQGGGCP